MSTRVSNAQALLLIANYLNIIEGRKRFQKIVFLLKERDKIPLTYRFTPYLYGPYSSELQNQINVLTRANFLHVSKVRNLFIYQITPLGQKTASDIENMYGQEQAQALEEKVNNYSEFETEELVNWSKEFMGNNNW